MTHSAVVPPLLRRVRGVFPCRRPLAAPAAATLTFTCARPYSVFTRKFSDTVTAKISQLTEDVWLADEKLVTEPRRPFVPQHALAQSLAERLATQRNVKRCLVPTSVKVDKSRQYVEFTWPAEVMRSVSAEDQVPPNTAHQSTTTSTSACASAAAPFSLPSSVSAAAAEAEANDERAVPLRTRALAEYLRAYTPSTDGALGVRDIVIYGRRGICISQIVPIGNYALRFVFSDDHAGGIYSYDYLFYLTGPATKYGLMRAYIKELELRRKSRDPPKRAPSLRWAKEKQRANNHQSTQARKQ